jgi:hypothetical protein
MIYLLIIAFVLFWLRGFADYLTQADAWGWRLPEWFNRKRNTVLFKWMLDKNGKPNWIAQIIPFRDHWHMWQFIRNRAHTLGSVFVFAALFVFDSLYVTSLLGVYQFPQMVQMICLIFAIVEIFWVVGHGTSFSIMKNMYNDKKTIGYYINLILSKFKKKSGTN